MAKSFLYNAVNHRLKDGVALDRLHVRAQGTEHFRNLTQLDHWPHGRPKYSRHVIVCSALKGRLLAPSIGLA